MIFLIISLSFYFSQRYLSLSNFKPQSSTATAKLKLSGILSLSISNQTQPLFNFQLSFSFWFSLKKASMAEIHFLGFRFMALGWWLCVCGWRRSVGGRGFVWDFCGGGRGWLWILWLWVLMEEVQISTKIHSHHHRSTNFTTHERSKWELELSHGGLVLIWGLELLSMEASVREDWVRERSGTWGKRELIMRKIIKNILIEGHIGHFPNYLYFLYVSMHVYIINFNDVSSPNWLGL